MRNLQLVSLEENSFNDIPLTGTAWDTDNDVLICAFGPTPTRPVIELKRKIRIPLSQRKPETLDQSEFVPITSWDAPCPLPELECDTVLLMHHFPDTATTCLVFAGGDLVLVRETPEPGQEAIEIVGSIDAGIMAAAWACDEEVLAVVTRNDNLILMSKNLEPVNEVAMTEQDLLASRHVSVGWGKKETQFQGKRAKAMRDPTMPEQVDSGEYSPFEDHSISMSWRGDGSYLAISAVIPNHRRVIRVYSREGILDSVSEPVDGLTSAISWQPKGNLIASAKCVGNGTGNALLQVIFFERNGLRHGEFDLRIDQTAFEAKAKSLGISWNIDSSVLAVSFFNSVQFWTMGNYHYYLKQDVNVSSGTEAKSLVVQWHPENPLRCCAHNNHKIINLVYDARVCRGSTITSTDYGTTAVIDGNILKLTPLRHVGIPPPLSYVEIDAKSNIVDCAISRHGQIVAILTQQTLQVYRWEVVAGNGATPNDLQRLSQNIKGLMELDLTRKFKEHTGFTKLCFRGDREVYLFSPARQNSFAQCVKVDISSGTDHITQLHIAPFAQDIICDVQQLTTWISDEQSTSCVHSNEPEASLSIPSFDAIQSNSTIFSLKVSDNAPMVGNGGEAYHRAYLTSKGLLYVDKRLLVRDCTSFVVTDTYLIYTTTQHLLKFVHLASPEDMEVPGDAPEIDERCRTVERGAKIVTVIPSIYATVLQMPRGNLETIYPRVLVLSGIRQSLQRLDYKTSFVACQVHQVDMNILYDHVPEKFMSNISVFIESLKRPNRIDEFISKLKDEDVSQTIYKDTSKNKKDSILNGHIKNQLSLDASHPVGKVNRICDAFIAILNTKPPKFLQNVITAHVCKRPPDLTAALTLVSSLGKTSSQEADIAVSHLCFLTDTNRLYDAALGLYDLDLTLLVAQNAQRDPREYMPFLQSLQALPALRRQYEIDNHLKHYSRALISLHSLKAHDEVEKYTIKHVLYTKAIDLYKYDNEHLPKMTTLYAEYLESHSQYAAAGILYESLQQYELAYPLYALAHRWRESLTCAALIPLDPTKMRGLAISLATTCAEESRDYRSAATINLEYLAEVPTAARLLCKGSYFAEATRVLALHGFAQETATIIDPGIAEKFGEIIELVADCKSQLAAQIPRINELRKKKEEDPLAFYGGDAAAMAADGVDIPDNISLAPTDATTAGGHSLFTRYGSNASKFGGTVASNVSRQTSKTKRREERKRARGKKGSVYEEEYLISSVGRLIERVNGIQDEVRRLIDGLQRRGMREQAAKVNEVMAEIHKSCEEARREVWQVKDQLAQPETESAYHINGEGRPPGADGVFWDSQQETSGPNKKHAPDVKPWAPNLLIVAG